MLKNLNTSNVFLLVCFVANIGTLPALTASAETSDKQTYPLGNDDTEFVFAGNCPTGEPYRFRSYQMDVDGLIQWFYDYEGPAGKGIVQANAQPRKMLTRLCHNLADINNGSKFD